MDGHTCSKRKDYSIGSAAGAEFDPDVRVAAMGYSERKRDGANAVITWNISTHLGRVPRRRRTRIIYHDAALFPSPFYNIIIIIIIIIIIRSTINCYDAPSRPIRQRFL